VREHINSIEMYGLMNQGEVEEYIALKFRAETGHKPDPKDNASTEIHTHKLGWKTIFDEDVPGVIFEKERLLFRSDQRYFSISPRHLNVVLIDALDIAAKTKHAKVTKEHIEQIY